MFKGRNLQKRTIRTKKIKAHYTYYLPSLFNHNDYLKLVSNNVESKQEFEDRCLEFTDSHVNPRELLEYYSKME